jgi:YhcH/YjgK/YiaL family protein
MIIDSIKSFERYKEFQKGFDKVYEFLRKNDLNTLELGNHPIVENDVWCTISESDARDVAQMPKMEVHDSFVDVHILLEGDETIGWKDRAKCENLQNAEYNEAQDVALFDEMPDMFVSCSTENFVMCFPSDAHTPLLGSGKIKKAVFKIRVLNEPAPEQ